MVYLCMTSPSPAADANWRLVLRVCGVLQEFVGDGPFLIGRLKCISRSTYPHTGVRSVRARFPPVPFASRELQLRPAW
jgi:hypothetical protein